ncbi:MAG TPA: sigma-70 family RNA polymerase sigma factor [Planctomycetota bacterium]|nr:sigma-70 family RNA polymerase sigma factor [Planctomycetota bacterium]
MVDEPDPGDTAALLRAWQAGDAGALDRLVARELPWLTRHVQRRLGALLRAGHDTQDIVQEALLGALRDGTRFAVEDRRRLRALLARIVENVIRREHEHLSAARRDVRRVRPLPSSSVVLHRHPHSPFTRPSHAAVANEERAWLRLALELLDADDRDLIVMREHRGLGFAAIGAALGIAEDAARMRWRRALGRLGRVLDGLRCGRIGVPLDAPAECP